MILLLLFICFWIGLGWRYSWIIFAILAVALIIFLWRRFSKKIAIIGLSIFLIGFGISWINISFKQETYSGFVVESKDNYFILSSKCERLYVKAKENTYEIGDYLAIKGEKKELDFSVTESAFDFEEYLNKKGIRYELTYSNINVKFSNFIRMKQYKHWFLSQFDDDAKGVVSSILFSQEIDSETIGIVDDLHMARLASASGIYIYAFIAVLEYFLEKKIKEKWTKLISLGLLSFYFIFTFPRFAVLKILVISVMRWFNNYIFKKKISYPALLALSGFLFLTFDYHLAYQDGFILGYLMPILFIFIRPIYEDKKKWKQKMLSSFIVYLFFIPFELKFYNSFEPFSFANQLLFTPYFVAIAFVSLISFYGVPIYKLINWIVFPLKYIFKPFEFLKWEIYAPNLSGPLLLFYYALFVLLIYYLSIKFKPIVSTLSLVYVCFLTLYCVPIQNVMTAEVSFVNVGQGDCCLIRKQNTTILIDTGGLKYTDLAKESLIPFLKKKRIYDVDLVITTHDDYDHSGALTSLKENFIVKNYVRSSDTFPLKYDGIELINYNIYGSGSSDENENSLVIGFSLMHTSFLITGDAPISIEKKIMEDNAKIPCDVLKVGHHGSNTSTSDAFIKYLKPKEAVISVGKNNSYGHPHKSVLDILKSNGVKIKRTDELGTITYSNYIFM